MQDTMNMHDMQIRSDFCPHARLTPPLPPTNPSYFMLLTAQYYMITKKSESLENQTR